MDYVVLTKSNGHFHKKRNEQNLRILSETINATLTEKFYSNEKIQQGLEKVKTDIIEDKISAYVAAQNLIEEYFCEIRK
jgi:LAO/AO transport system kinase